MASALLRYRDELFIGATNPGAEFAHDQFAEAAEGAGEGRAFAFGRNSQARNFVMVELGAGFGKWSRARPNPHFAPSSARHLSLCSLLSTALLPEPSCLQTRPGSRGKCCRTEHRNRVGAGEGLE